MGRGRAKAKQQKVARRLKYNSGGTDLERLRSELGVAEDNDAPSEQLDDAHEDPYDDLVDRYADYADSHGGGDSVDDSAERANRSS